MHSAFMASFGERLKRARERKYETASDAARALKMPVGTYSGHENGNRGGLAHAERYARFFGCDYRWLSTGKGDIDGDPLLTLIEDIPESARPEAIDFLRFLQQKRKSPEK